VVDRHGDDRDVAVGPVAVSTLDVELDPANFAVIEEAVPRGAAAGDRYHARQMAALDNER
jgi:hypothetical protein